MERKILRKELAAIFIFSAALLAIELSFTKFFSVVMWYHFGFLIVSTAMLGFAVSGIYLTLKPEKSEKLSLPLLIPLAAGVTLLSYAMLTWSSKIEVDPTSIAARIGELALMVTLLFLPFFFMGLTISWVITHKKEKVGLYYGANLIGSAFGAPLFLLTFDTFNGQSVIVINTLLMLTAALFVIPKKRIGHTLGAVAALALIASFPGLFPMDPPKDKMLGYVKKPAADITHTGWSSLSKVDFVKDPDRTIYPSVGLWGLDPQYERSVAPFPERMGIIIDSWAYTSVLAYPQDLSFFDYMPTTFVYHLGKSYEKSLHIGAGGGLDLLAAHHYGVESVKGVEINPVIVETVKEKFRDFSGGIYSGGIDGIEVFVDEGRHFVEESNDTYDLIQLSGVDTFSSTQAGAFALSENNLYTVEAVKSYYRHLKEGGMLTMTRWFSPDARGNYRYSLRLLNIAREALREMKAPIEGSVFFFVSRQYTLLTIKKGTFTREESAKGMEFISSRRFLPLLLPGEKNTKTNIYARYLYADDESFQSMLDSYPYNVEPPTDDKPFFFELRKLETLFIDWSSFVAPLDLFSGQTVLFILLAELGLLGIVLILLPLFFLSKRRSFKPQKRALLFFSIIGLCFMLVEICLSQKLVLYLGHPTYSLSVVLLSMLLFSGLGSIVSDRFRIKESLLLLLPAIMALELLFMHTILTSTLHQPFGIRLVITLLLISPLAFLMGMPFPSWIRKSRKSEIPFLWGVNGFFSTVASVTCVIMSINLGFTAVFATALGGYTLAVLLLLMNGKKVKALNG